MTTEIPTLEAPTVPPPTPVNSVTAGDINPSRGFTSGGLNGYFPMYIPRSSSGGLLPDLPGYWTPERDRVLASTLDYPGHWAGAVSIAVAQFTAKSYEFDGVIPEQKEAAQELFANSNSGQGITHLFSQMVTDFLTTDNGAILEIERESDSPAAKIRAIHHLDSLRCVRTGNPLFPIIYWNNYTGGWHKLAWYQCYSLVDSPNTRSNYYGIGHCATARAYDRIRRLQAIERYIYEKLTGTGMNQLILLPGLSPAQLEGILKTNENNKAAQGIYVYGGVGLVPAITKEGISPTTIDLQGPPPNFDEDKEIQQALLLYANSIGLDVQDLMPMASQQLGVGAQSAVLMKKAKGKGLAVLSQRWLHFVNRWLLPPKLAWAWIEKDLDDELKRSQFEKNISDSVASLGRYAMIDAAMGQKKLVKEDVLPADSIPNANTINTPLEDDEQAELELDFGQFEVAPALFSPEGVAV